MTTTFPPTGKVRLKTNLADNPVVRALKAGEVKSDLVEFDFELLQSDEAQPFA